MEGRPRDFQSRRRLNFGIPMVSSWNVQAVRRSSRLRTLEIYQWFFWTVIRDLPKSVPFASIRMRSQSLGRPRESFSTSDSPNSPFCLIRRIRFGVAIVRRSLRGWFVKAGCNRRLADLRFMEAVGHTVFDEIHAVRIERVKDLLMKPGQEVFAIPNLCGYGSLADLCRDFKKRTGQTLRGWRSSGAR